MRFSTRLILGVILLFVCSFSLVVVAQTEPINLNLTQEDAASAMDDVNAFSQIPEYSTYDQLNKDGNYVIDPTNRGGYYANYKGDGFKITSDGTEGSLVYSDNEKLHYTFKYNENNDAYTVTNTNYGYNSKFDIDGKGPVKEKNVQLNYQYNPYIAQYPETGEKQFESSTLNINYGGGVRGQYDYNYVGGKISGTPQYSETLNLKGNKYYYNGDELYKLDADGKYDGTKDKIKSQDYGSLGVSKTQLKKDYDARKKFADEQKKNDPKDKTDKKGTEEKLGGVKEKEETKRSALQITQELAYESRRELSDFLGSNSDWYQEYKDGVDSFFARSFDFVTSAGITDAICSEFLPPITSGSSIAPIMSSPDDVRKPFGMILPFKETGFPVQCYTDQECVNKTGFDNSQCIGNVCQVDNKPVDLNYYLIEVNIRTPTSSFMYGGGNRFKFSVVVGNIIDGKENDYEKEKYDKLKYVEIDETLLIGEYEKDDLGGLYRDVMQGYIGADYDVACINILKGHPVVSSVGDRLQSVCGKMSELISIEKVIDPEQIGEVDPNINYNPTSGIRSIGGI